MRPETVPWWRQALADLASAHAVRVAGQFYAVSWFSQQAVEKGIKALHVEQHAALAPRTHDLAYLGAQVAAPASVIADLTFLNPAFDLVRYPSDSGDAPVDSVTEELSARHMAAAERVLAWISGQLHPPASRP